MSRFRSFLYIDHEEVESLLSGVEGGTFSEESQREQGGSGWGGRAEGRVGPVGGSYTGDVRDTHERSRTMQQTAEARFSRLMQEIDDDPDESVLVCSSGSSNPWREAEENRFVRFTGSLDVPEFVVALANSGDYLRIGQAFENVGAIQISKEQRNALEGMASVNEAIGERLPIFMETGLDHPTVVLPLTSRMSRARIDRYAGRATVVGRVSERVPERTKHTLFEIPGMRQMNRKQRRAGGDRGMQNLEVEGPALILNVIAVFQ